MNAQRIIGFFLLGLGVAIVLYALYASSTIFTGSSEAPALFAPSEQSAQRPPSDFSPQSLQDIQSQFPELLQGQLQGLLPQGSIPQMLNLAAWSIFAGLLIFGGTQLAGLGIKLLK